MKRASTNPNSNRKIHKKQRDSQPPATNQPIILTEDDIIDLSIVEEVINWIDENRPFFIAMLNGDLKQWANNKEADENFAPKKTILNAFREKLLAAFANGKTNDTRPHQFHPDPWMCFMHSIIDLKSDGLEPSSSPSNPYYKGLRLFFTENIHIAQCLGEHRKLLAEVMQQWEQEHVENRNNTVVAWIDENLQFFKDVLNEQVINWISTQYKVISNPPVINHLQFQTAKNYPTKSNDPNTMEKFVHGDKSQYNLGIYYLNAYRDLYIFDNNVRQILTGDKSSKSELLSALSDQAMTLAYIKRNVNLTKYLEKYLILFDGLKETWKILLAKPLKHENKATSNSSDASDKPKIISEPVTTVSIYKKLGGSMSKLFEAIEKEQSNFPKNSIKIIEIDESDGVPTKYEVSNYSHNKK